MYSPVMNFVKYTWSSLQEFPSYDPNLKVVIKERILDQDQSPWSIAMNAIFPDKYFIHI